MPELTQWTAADQARVDSFEQEISKIADLASGHPDIMVLAFIQVTGTLMLRNLLVDPAGRARYRQYIERLANHIDCSVLPEYQVNH